MRRQLDSQSLAEIGLGGAAQTALYLISLLPFVGIVIGINYRFRRNTATRQLGQRIFVFSMALHAFYLLCICPAITAIALNQ